MKNVVKILFPVQKHLCTWINIAFGTALCYNIARKEHVQCCNSLLVKERIRCWRSHPLIPFYKR